ncbi:MAG: L,D-transpeptidase family protein [Actinomycetota bacterium]
MSVVGEIQVRRIVALVMAVLVMGIALPASASLDDLPPTPERLFIPGEMVANPPLIDLAPGSRGQQVADLQQELKEAGFFPGPIDGSFGRSTLGAVYAFQKLYELDRTGVFRAADWRMLDRSIRGPGPAPEADRIEVDLSRQVMYLIEAEQVSGVFPISSGNGEKYRNARGRLVTATTPEGRFTFRRSRQGWWESYLGFMYQPFYFYGGYAIHGSGSVPPFPASHGCVRVEIADMDLLSKRIRVGMPIYLYGVNVSRGALLPPVEDQPGQGNLDHGPKGLFPLV